MAITRERKEELISEYDELIGATDGFIVTEYRGMTVEKMSDLRNRLMSSGSVYTVTKNNLFRIALSNRGWPVPEALLVGPTAVVFGNGKLQAAAKTVQDFVKDNPDFFIVKGGMLQHSMFGADDLEAITKLPTIEEIRAQLLGMMTQPASHLVGLFNQPGSKFAGVMQAATSQLANVIQAYLDKTQAPADAGEPAA